MKESESMKNIKFTMNLVWHNCLECPPEESHNSCLFMTDSVNVFPVTYDNVSGWYDIVDGCRADVNSHHYWADIEQTVQGDERFRGKE